MDHRRLAGCGVEVPVVVEGRRRQKVANAEYNYGHVGDSSLSVVRFLALISGTSLSGFQQGHRLRWNSKTSL